VSSSTPHLYAKPGLKHKGEAKADQLETKHLNAAMIEEMLKGGRDVLSPEGYSSVGHL